MQISEIERSLGMLEFLEKEAGAQELMSPLSTVFYESEDNDEKNDY